MTLLHLSDTHGEHRLLHDLPAADVIIHTGDFTKNGKAREVLEFLDWFFHLDYRYKIFVAGNHDECLEDGNIADLPEGCHYLCYSGVEIEGIRFWGIPYFLGVEARGEMGKLAAEIPDSVDILVSHRPPYGILDCKVTDHFGCRQLLKAVERIQPRFHLFGHVHANYGCLSTEKTIYLNAALMRRKRFQNYPFIIDW